MNETDTTGGVSLREGLLTDTKQGLGFFRDRINPFLSEYMDEVVAEARKEDELISEALAQTKKIVLSGGKRLRAALMCAGYFAADGTDEERILRTSMSVELTHAFLLIHDDIIDRDPLRHGVETIHEYYSRRAGELFPGTDAPHFGNSVGIIVGDMMAALGNDVIFRSGFPLPRVFESLSMLQKIISYTVIGQGMDLALEYRRQAAKDDILRMYEYKTAKYTIEGPLVLGALLAGASEDVVQALRRFSLPLGVAFQIRDDILGTFGTREKIGKPVDSDLGEGKRTILTYFALESASDSVCKEIENLLEKRSPNESDVERFRILLRETGALDSSSEYMVQLVEEAKREIRSAGVPADVERFLVSVSDYVSERVF
ncbi:MAG: polyprenyl synthetase family protein [Candidatus Moranbacteria bacterium]|nr:polyprenyl synthetase family protein [Candidatus Moranbacteria bacterium]